MRDAENGICRVSSYETLDQVDDNSVLSLYYSLRLRMVRRARHMSNLQL